MLTQCILGSAFSRKYFEIFHEIFHEYFFFFFFLFLSQSIQHVSCIPQQLIRYFFIRKLLISFLFLNENICCGYSLEAPCQGASNEYPQHMFSLRNKKNIMWIPPLICSYVSLVDNSCTRHWKMFKGCVFSGWQLHLLGFASEYRAQNFEPCILRQTQTNVTVIH